MVNAFLQNFLDWSLLTDALPTLIGVGLVNTLVLSLFSMLLGIIAGMALALLAVAPARWFRLPAYSTHSPRVGQPVHFDRQGLQFCLLSRAAVLAVRDLFTIGQNTSVNTANLSPLVAAGLVYLLVTVPLTHLINYVDRWTNRHSNPGYGMMSASRSRGAAAKAALAESR